LYEKLLDKTDHVKVWISFAEFEVSIPDEEEEEEEEEEGAERVISDAAKARGRGVFDRAYRRMKERDLKEEVCSFLPSTLCNQNANIQRVVLLESWKQYELTYGNETTIAKVEDLMPKVIKKRRKLDDGSYEEYFDYIFKDGDEENQKVLNLLKKAQEWRQRMQGQNNN